MIRFIEVGNQVLDDARYFSWWCTVTDRYLEFNGEQMWETWHEFTIDLHCEHLTNVHAGLSSRAEYVDLGSRLLGLYPKYRKNREGEK